MDTASETSSLGDVASFASTAASRARTILDCSRALKSSTCFVDAASTILGGGSQFISGLSDEQKVTDWPRDKHLAVLCSFGFCFPHSVVKCP